MYILPDNKDIYLPYRNGMFTKLDKNGKMLLKNFLKSLNKMFESTRDRGSCLGSVLKLLSKINLNAYNSKIIIFQSTLPTAGLYNLENRTQKIKHQNSEKKDTEKEKEQEKKNEPEQEQEPEKGKKSSRRKSKVNTEKEIVGSTLEMQLLTPNAHNGEFYSTVSKILASSGHTFFLFLFGKEYLDIATLSQLAINSNGEIFYYPRIDFQKRPDISKTFSSNLKKIVTQWYSNNITTRTRVSHNIMIKNTYGYHGIKSTLASKKIPTMTSYNSIMFGISVRPTNNIPNNAAIQLVIIYSLQSGEERLRIITRQFKTSNDFGLLFRSINLDLLYHFYLQVGLRSFNVYSSKKIVSTLINNCKQLIKNSIQGKKYDNNLRYPPMKNSNRLKDGNVEVKGQERKSEIEERVGLIKKLPDSLKLVAFYTCSLVKSSMFGKPTFMNINDRSFLLGHFFKNNLIETKSYICPLFYSLPIDLQNYHNSQPIRIPLTKKSLKIDGLFLMTNSQEILFLIGNKINSKIINYLFDLGSIENIEPNLLTLLKLKNKYNKYVWNFIQQIQHLYFRKIPIHFIKFGLQRKIENEYINWFVEDQTPSSPSYQDFISTLEITLNDF
ncbi:sec24-related protein [Anaeramoeba flamelloides]|uniref:Sec24-related protein n=1 Tax=Anaeramoeba flamelloides TaxID=1746091 RepID=A0ABQ8Y1T4_9EUKA|nr:sec24-related protein [Anaeramoeba flamelloides]